MPQTLYADDFLSGGFADAPRDAARAFRACLEAMARPGRVQAVTGAQPPAPLSPAAGAVVLTLVDASTPLWIAPSLATEAVRGWIAFHCGAPLCAPEDAAFALTTWGEAPLAALPVGTPEYPDRAATLIVETEALTPPTHRLTGPGIETRQDARLPASPFWAENRAIFPLGLDAFFTCGDAICALPRSTVTEVL